MMQELPSKEWRRASILSKFSTSRPRFAILFSALAAKVERACVGTGLELERRAFHPHITLARWNRRSEAVSRFLQRNRGLASTPFAVKAFTLYESHLSRHGAHYEAVADYGLCSSRPEDFA